MTTWFPDMRRPAFATRVLCDVAAERGVAASEVLSGSGIRLADLDDPDATVSAWDEILTVRGLLSRLPDDVGVGADVGSRFTLTHVGLMGFAAMSCATLRELFDIAMRYFALTMLHIDIKLFEGAHNCVLETNVDHLPEDVQRFFAERDVAAVITAISGFALPVVQRYADQVVSESSVDEAALRPLLDMLPLHNIAFGRAHDRLHFPRAMLDEPLPQADRHTLEMCVAQCEVLMQRIERRRGITAVVRSKLFRDSGGFPALPDVAAELNMHPRTLRRHLAEEGASFRDLLNEARATVAVDLLCNVGLTVEETSKRLGYSDVSTFSHAFKRWHGAAPSGYRPATSPMQRGPQGR